jgi:hypothetical protein
MSKNSGEESDRSNKLYLKNNKKLLHNILVVLIHVTQLTLEIYRNLKIKITGVSLIWLDGHLSSQSLALLDGDVVTQIEDRLLPVSVARIWSGRKTHSFVATRKFNSEKGDQCLKIPNIIQLFDTWSFLSNFIICIGYSQKCKNFGRVQAS